jgi:hypothetical protein
MRKVKISIAVSLITLVSIAAAGPVAAAAPNPPSCMGVDMGTWAREGSTAGVTGPATFDSGSGWGGHVAQNARFSAGAWGQAMVDHLAGDFYGVPGITCQ